MYTKILSWWQSKDIKTAAKLQQV